MILSNKWYDRLKITGRLIVPIITALCALYGGLARVWGLPLADEISQTGTLIGAFITAVLNAFLEILRKMYDEEMAAVVVDEDEEDEVSE